MLVSLDAPSLSPGTGLSVAAAASPNIPSPEPAEEESLPARPVAAPQNSAPESEEASWPSEGAELAAMADARERGDGLPVIPGLSTEASDEADKRGLPELAQVLEKLPADLRQTLEELFRARWTRVTRVRKKDLNQA